MKYNIYSLEGKLIYYVHGVIEISQDGIVKIKYDGNLVFVGHIQTVVIIAQ